MLPLLQFLADGEEHKMRDATNALAVKFELTETERKELLPSGSGIFENRVGWARMYLKKAGLIQSPKWGHLQITGRGRNTLAQSPAAIEVVYLKQFPEFVEYYTGEKPEELTAAQSQEAVTETPEELLAVGHQKLRRQLEADLLARVKSCPLEFFERLVVRLLIAMGYGGSLTDAGRAIGKTGDGGIDGIIKEDKLGLDILLVQAKRWNNTTVGRPDVQAFVGALHGRKARKGMFITTSTFSKDAREYADGLEIRVILIDGSKLAELMFEHDVGVSAQSSYVVKRIDTDFFDDAAGQID